MINLGDRLLTIANMIEDGETVADIGTDHGYLPIHLLLESRSPSAILTDISGGSLNKARINCAEMLHGQKYDLREGDGLEILEPGEVDAVVMAGIGGLLTIEILDWDLEKSRSFKKLIMQPRNNGGALRKYLAVNGFSLDEFRIVPEGERFCEVMRVIPKANLKDALNVATEADSISEAEWDFPEEIISSLNPDGRFYLEKCLQQEEIIIEKIRTGLENADGNSKNSSGEKDIEYRKERIARIKDLLSRLYEDH